MLNPLMPVIHNVGDVAIRDDGRGDPCPLQLGRYSADSHSRQILCRSKLHEYQANEAENASSLMNLTWPCWIEYQGSPCFVPHSLILELLVSAPLPNEIELPLLLYTLFSSDATPPLGNVTAIVWPVQSGNFYSRFCCPNKGPKMCLRAKDFPVRRTGCQNMHQFPPPKKGPPLVVVTVAYERNSSATQ